MYVSKNEYLCCKHSKLGRPEIQSKSEVQNKLCKCKPSKLGKPESQLNLLKLGNLK